MTSEPTTYDAYLELRDDGSCLAQLLDLPGCYSLAGSQAASLSALAAAIPRYFDWLRRHDDYTPEVHGPFAVLPREVVRVSSVNTAPGSAFFSPSATPVTAEDLDWFVALLDWAFADFYALVSAQAVGATDARRPGGVGPTAEQVADEVAQQQLWLLSRIEPQPRVPQLAQLPGTSLDKLRQVWQASLHRLRNTQDDERERILEHDGERWSLRAVLRCSVLLVRMRTDTLVESCR